MKLDPRPAHRVALLASVDVVERVRRDDLGLATPCAAWDLGQLLAHMTVQNRGLAAAARGDGADLAHWDVASVEAEVIADPAGTYAAAAHDVLEAFAGDVLDAPFALPELGRDATFPGRLAIGFHLIDYVAHGWDVARSIDAPFDLPADVVAAAEPIAFAVPNGAERRSPRALFRTAVDVGPGSGRLDRILAHLGRSPEWIPRPVRCA